MKNKLISMLGYSITFLIIASCSGEGNDISNSIDDSEYLWYFSGKLNGEPFIYGQKANESIATYEISTSNTQPSTCVNSSNNGFSYNSGVYPSFDDSLPSMDIEFNRMHICSEGSQNDLFDGLFDEKSYDFAMNNNDIDENAGKVALFYYPNVNSIYGYKTYNGDQSGSFFKVTSSTQYQGSSLKRLLKGEFSATFYKENNLSDKVEITDGRFKIVFIP